MRQKQQQYNGGSGRQWRQETGWGLGIKLAPLDFASASSGTIKIDLNSPRQGLEIINESINGLDITVPQTSDSYSVPPQHKRVVIFPHPYQEAYWAIDYSLSAINAPLNQAFLRVLSPQEVQDAIDSGAIDIPLSARQANIGNQSLNVSSVPELVNDGNNPNTTIIEATPSDQTGSALIVRNDGSAQWDILSASSQLQVLEVIRGDHVNAKATVVLGDVNDYTITSVYGTAEYANNVPAGGISGIIPSGQIGVGYPATDLSGNLPSSQISGIIPASQISSGYPAGDIAAGALVAGVTSPNYLALAGGTMTGLLSSDIPGSSTGGVNHWRITQAAGSGITAGDYYIGVNTDGTLLLWDNVAGEVIFELKDKNISLQQITNYSGTHAPNGTNAIGFNLNGVPGYGGVQAADTAVLASANTFRLKQNNYWDGTSDRYVTANPAYQLALLSGTLRIITNTGSPVAGGVITWGNWLPIDTAENLDDPVAGNYINSSGGVVRLGGTAHMVVQLNHGSGITGFSMFTGTTAGSTAVNHGLGATPTVVLVTPKVAGISYTISVTNFTATQVTILQDSGTSIPFTAIAFY